MPVTTRPSPPRHAPSLAVFCLLALCVLPWRARISGSDDAAPSTKAMAALLADLTRKVDAKVLWFNVNDVRARLLGLELDTPRALADDLRVRVLYATELSYAGQYSPALEQIERVLAGADEAGPALGGDFLVNVLMLQATTLLRMGEEQNCAEGLQQRFVPDADSRAGRAYPPRRVDAGDRGPGADPSHRSAATFARAGCSTSRT